MLKEESNWAQACDSCRSAACTVYCHADSAYLCTSCDAQIHAVNCLASRHERVRVCQSCERAPAAFFCKADAASLCIACDSEIHSANPLARRHQRVPILPISGNSYGSMETNHSCETTVTEPENSLVVGQEEEDRDEAEAASWLLPERSYRGDGVVPLQVDESRGRMHHGQHNLELGITYAPRSSNGSISHMVHVSSMDLIVVPESTTSDATVSQPRSPKAVTDQLTEPPPQMLSPVEREARVLGRLYQEVKNI